MLNLTTKLLIALVLFLASSFSLSEISAEAEPLPGFKVILASSTFTPAALKELQPIADQVSGIVDSLIPGVPQDYPPDGIICFEAPSRWSTQDYKRMGFSPPPVTVNGPRTYDEPIEARDNTVRIAVFGVQTFGPDRWRFAFQLSHELAHVKMGTRSGNYLDETFAVALSYEVLRRLGYEGYLLLIEGADLKELPPDPQRALALGRWKEAQAFWLERSKIQKDRMDDRVFQTLGASLILWQKGEPHWAELLNAGLANTCSSSVQAHTFRICDPDFYKMRHQTSFLKRLGINPP